MPEVEAIATSELLLRPSVAHRWCCAEIASICMDRERVAYLRMKELGLPTNASYRFAGSLEELRAGAKRLPVRGQADYEFSGHGQSVVRSRRCD